MKRAPKRMTPHVAIYGQATPRDVALAVLTYRPRPKPKGKVTDDGFGTRPTISS